MAKKQLKIQGASVRMAEPAREAAEPAAAQPPLEVSIEVENPSDAPLHVWSSVRAYDYDPVSRKLTLHLAEREPNVPPGIQILSHHPQIPQQVVVNPGSRSTINVKVSSVVRRRVPGQGLGMSFVEEPIGPVDEVEVRIQHSPEPLTSPPGENPEELQRRLRETGASVQSVIRLTRSKGR